MGENERTRKKKTFEPKNVPCTFCNHFWFIVFQQSQQQVEAAAGKCAAERGKELGAGSRTRGRT